MRAEGEKTPEPTPPSSPKPMISIDDTSVLNRQNESSNLPTLIKVNHFYLKQFIKKIIY